MWFVVKTPSSLWLINLHSVFWGWLCRQAVALNAYLSFQISLIFMSIDLHEGQGTCELIRKMAAIPKETN